MLLLLLLFLFILSFSLVRNESSEAMQSAQEGHAAEAHVARQEAAIARAQAEARANQAEDSTAEQVDN